MSEAIRAIARTARHGAVTDVIRTAIAAAHLWGCEYGTNLFLRNREGQQRELSIPVQHKPDAGLDYIIQIRCEMTTLRYIDELAANGFGGTPSDIIRRSLSFYRFLLQCREDGWDCVYVDEAGQFTKIQLDLSVAATTSQATKPINFRANADMTEAITTIARTADHASASDAIRTAIAAAHLWWCEYGNNLALMNRDGRQMELCVPVQDKLDARLDYIIQVRCDSVMSNYLQELASNGFGTTLTDIIRRSLRFYRFLLQRREDGWDCIYTDKAGQSMLVPIITLARSH